MCNYKCLYNGTWVFPFTFLCLSFPVSVTQIPFSHSKYRQIPVSIYPFKTRYFLYGYFSLSACLGPVIDIDSTVPVFYCRLGVVHFFQIFDFNLQSFNFNSTLGEFLLQAFLHAFWLVIRPDFQKSFVGKTSQFNMKGSGSYLIND